MQKYHSNMMMDVEKCADVLLDLKYNGVAEHKFIEDFVLIVVVC